MMQMISLPKLKILTINSLIIMLKTPIAISRVDIAIDGPNTAIVKPTLTLLGGNSSAIIVPSNILSMDESE